MKRRQTAAFLGAMMILSTITGCANTEDLKNAMSNMGATETAGMNTDVQTLKEITKKEYGETDGTMKAWLDDVKNWCETNHQTELANTSAYDDTDDTATLAQKCEAMLNKLNALLNTVDAYTSNDDHEHSFWLVYDTKEVVSQPSYNESVTTPATYEWVTEEERLVTQKETIVQPEEYETVQGCILPNETKVEHEAIYCDIYEPAIIKKHAKQVRTVHHDAQYRWEWVPPVMKKVTYKKGSKINIGDAVFDHYEEPVYEETNVPAKTVSVTYPEYGTYDIKMEKDYDLVFDQDTYAICYCNAVIKYEDLEAHRTAFMLANMFDESTPWGVYDPIREAVYEVDKDTMRGAHNGYGTFTTLDVDKSTFERVSYATYKRSRAEQTVNIVTNPAHTEYNRIKAGRNIYRKATAGDVKTFDKDTTVETGEVQTDGYWKKVKTADAYDEQIEICPAWTEWDDTKDKSELVHKQLMARNPFTETIVDGEGDFGDIRRITQEEIKQMTDLPEEEQYYETVQLDEPKQVEVTKEKTEIKFYDAVTEYITEPKCWACSHQGCKETRPYDPENPAPPEIEQPEETENEDQKAAQSVINIISAIGDVTYDKECRARIDEARNAYDALTDAQKTLVSNLNVLTDAETRYKELETEAEQNMTDEEKALATDAKIEAIGQVQFNPQVKTRIETARTAYEKLSDSAKRLVKNYDVLDEAEGTYRILKDKAAEIKAELEETIEWPPEENDVSSCETFFTDVTNAASRNNILNDKATQAYMIILENTANEGLVAINDNNNAGCEKYRKQILGMVRGCIRQLSEDTWATSKTDLLSKKCYPNVYDEDFMEWATLIEIYAIRTNDGTLKNIAATIRSEYPDETAVDNAYADFIDNLSGTGSLRIQKANQIILEGNGGK